MKGFSLIYLVFLVVQAGGKPSFNIEQVNVDGYQTEAFENGFLFQKDMLLRKPVLQKALQGKDVTKEESTKRCIGGACVDESGFGRTVGKWSNPRRIPYVMSKSAKCRFFGKIKHFFLGLFDDSRKCHATAIEDGIKEWEKHTCLRFVEISESQARREPGYIEFTSSGYGQCYAHVGFIGGRQVVNIDDGCSTTGIVVHEIGHALGLHHEQSRPDRDNFVKVSVNNAKAGTELNFKKYSFSEINTVGSPYDYGSIMHYGNKYFSKNGRDTITPVQNGRLRPDISIGQRSRLSQADKDSVNKYYCR